MGKVHQWEPRGYHMRISLLMRGVIKQEHCKCLYFPKVIHVHVHFYIYYSKQCGLHSLWTRFVKQCNLHNGQKMVTMAISTN